MRYRATMRQIPASIPRRWPRFWRGWRRTSDDSSRQPLLAGAEEDAAQQPAEPAKAAEQEGRAGHTSGLDAQLEEVNIPDRGEDCGVDDGEDEERQYRQHNRHF